MNLCLDNRDGSLIYGGCRKSADWSLFLLIALTLCIHFRKILAAAAAALGSSTVGHGRQGRQRQQVEMVATGRDKKRWHSGCR